MRKSWVVALACVTVVGMAACQKKDNSEKVTSDTATVTGHDTVNGQSVPVTDTVVKTTTSEVDTMQGKANADTAKKK